MLVQCYSFIVFFRLFLTCDRIPLVCRLQQMLTLSSLMKGHTEISLSNSPCPCLLVLTPSNISLPNMPGVFGIRAHNPLAPVCSLLSSVSFAPLALCRYISEPFLELSSPPLPFPLKSTVHCSADGDGPDLLHPRPCTDVYMCVWMQKSVQKIKRASHPTDDDIPLIH
jgi:hypothetical protein